MKIPACLILSCVPGASCHDWKRVWMSVDFFVIVTDDLTRSSLGGGYFYSLQFKGIQSIMVCVWPEGVRVCAVWYRAAVLSHLSRL